MSRKISRRMFLYAAGIGGGTLLMMKYGGAQHVVTVTPSASRPAWTPVDLHVHLDNSNIDQALGLAKERDVKLGIVEHAGSKENKYPVVLSNDEELGTYLASLDGKPVYKGIQAEFTDWAGCFSKEVLARLDFVLGDAMTMPNAEGHRQKMWEREADIGESEAFMDRYVEWHETVMSTGPIDIMANLTWLPGALMPQYDALWTEVRMRKVIDIALKYGVALEISSSLLLPRMPFLKMAKAAGTKFTFGSNGRYPNMGKLEYCFQVAKDLELTPKDLFDPDTMPSRAKKAVGKS